MRLRSQSKADLLKAVPLFSRLSGKQLSAIASIADEVELKPGKQLTAEGARGREFFVLLDGSADVRRKGKKVNAMGPGDFLGEISLLTHVPRTATVTTNEATRALVIRGPEFRALMRRMPELQLKVLDALAQRLAHDELA
jgi:CRP/FNR family transcriptional regulator, cyclic AMP receptor protein